MKTWSPLPRSTTLVSPVTRVTPASSQACRIEATIRCRSASGKALFEDEGRREEQRPRPADGQVVHRAVHGQLADVAAREEERPDHERIGREGDRGAFTPLPPRPPRRTVAWSSSAASTSLPNAGTNSALDQVIGQLPAAAVAEQDVVVLRTRHRAGAEQACRRRAFSHVVPSRIASFELQDRISPPSRLDVDCLASRCRP